jgi:hypothetical protein
MSRPLATLEQLLERLIERPIGRLFGVSLEAVRLQRRLERTMGEHRLRRDGRTVVPDRYRVMLHPPDLAALLATHPLLESEIAEALAAHARQRGWTLADRPRVTLRPSPAIGRGDVAVTATAADPEGWVTDGIDAPAFEATAVLGAVAGPRAILVAQAPGEPECRAVIELAPVRVGRAADNDLVLSDRRVSRHHGVLSPGQGTIVYRDLGSANGSFLGASRVGEVALGVGDVLRIGDSTVRVERA